MSANKTTVRRAWLVRGAKGGRFDRWMIESSYAGVGFKEIPRLDQARDLPAMRQLLAAHLPDAKHAAVGTWAAQLNAFANKITIGDIVVLPLKSERLLAIGTVLGDYEYLKESEGLKHVRKVRWEREDVARASIKQDLLYSLGAFSTVCELKRNDAAYRLERIRAGAEVDPGARSGVPLILPKTDPEVPDSEDAIESDGQDIVRYSRDRILTRIREQYKGHALQDLVAAILSAEGMTCKVQRKGADGGVDIIAGSGVLGISSPTIIVQVKSQQSSVGSEVLDQLGGVVSQHHADHGLLVTLGGITAAAKTKVNLQQLKVAVWDAEELLDRLLEHYEVMPEEVKHNIPLRTEWIIHESVAE